VRHIDINRDDAIIPAHLVRITGRRSDVELPRDTVTKRGNFVRYLLAEDSCCADNVYLRWGNAQFSRTYIMPRVRLYRSYFTPLLVHETKDYLILEHGCATSCSAVLFLPLNKSEPPRDISEVVGYDPQSYTVVHGLTNPHQETDTEFLQATNIKTRQVKRIIFKHNGTAVQKTKQIDSCRIDKQDIYLSATLYDSQKDEEVMEEVRLPNDIR
jgi:hypothetical protein